MTSDELHSEQSQACVYVCGPLSSVHVWPHFTYIYHLHTLLFIAHEMMNASRWCVRVPKS